MEAAFQRDAITQAVIHFNVRAPRWHGYAHWNLVATNRYGHHTEETLLMSGRVRRPRGSPPQTYACQPLTP